KLEVGGAVDRCETPRLPNDKLGLMRAFTFLLATGLVYAQSGDWLLTTTEFGAPQYQRIDFKFDGEKITGRAGNLTYEGTLRDGRVAFESKRADGSTIT